MSVVRLQPVLEEPAECLITAVGGLLHDTSGMGDASWGTT